ncbi:Smr/MutS family protein [Moraxella sp. ZY210820]|uniref:Smr/MutS family protein n=1 Tax=unclassified Moraxella TaxID=2685852 RepID=UPI00351F078B
MSKSPFATVKSELNQLKQQLKNAEIEQKIAEQQAQQHAENSDENVFAKAMAGVKPLPPSNQAVIERPKKGKIDAQILARRAAAEGEMQTDETLLSDTRAMLNPVGSQQQLSYKIRTLQDKVFDDLKTGKLPWFEAVDLHGCTVEQARTAVLQIIQMAKDEQQTVLKIVHGKGGDGGVLKTYVNGWLRQHPDVLAFVSAPSNQGGSGAVLVLIKRVGRDKTRQD